MAFDVRFERRGAHIGVITIDNPPVNALHPDVARAIGEQVSTAAADPALRVIVLTGAGKHFMAGGDIAYMQSLDRYGAERYVLGVQQMQDTLSLLPQPVIAAINGTALGGGCELAMACDIRIADERAVLGQPEVCLGLIPGAGGTQNLPRLVPHGRAKQLLFTGDRIPASEALSIGLVDQIAPAGSALEVACEVAERIAANAPAAVAAAKRAVNLGLQAGLVDGHRIEASLFAPLVDTADFGEGTTAFFEKRPATFHRT